MAIKLVGLETQVQAFAILVARQAGNNFHKSIKAHGEYKGEEKFACVGTMEAGTEVKVRLFSGEDVVIDAGGLTANLVLTESDIEALNGLEGNAFIIGGTGVISMNTNGGTQYEGNVWVTPNYPQEFQIKAAPQRTRALSAEELQASLNTGINRSLAARLAAATENAAKRAEERQAAMKRMEAETTTTPADTQAVTK